MITRIKFDNKKLSQVLKNKSYYLSGTRDYGTLSMELEEFYHGLVIDKLLALYNADLEYETAKHLENTIYSNFKNAFVDAVRMTKADKRSIESIEINSYISYLEANELDIPDSLTTEDDDHDYLRVDEIDQKLSLVKGLLSNEENKYLDLRLNGQYSVAEVKEAMNLSNNGNDTILKSIKRKCKHLKVDEPRYRFKPYGEIDNRTTLEEFSLYEWNHNQYVNFVSSNELSIHVEKD